jgi:glycosidase
VSYKNNADGTQSPYELNINYLDALGDPDAPSESVELVAHRFLASQAIMLALRGVPGIYFHSLFGSRNWRAGVEQTGRYRTINRQKLQRRQLETELADTGSLRCLVFNGLRRMLAARKASPAFHPSGGQRALEVHKAVLALLRSSPGGENQVLCLHNTSNQGLELAIDLQRRPIGEAGGLRDVLGGGVYALENGCLRLELEPYGVRWLAR